MQVVQLKRSKKWVVIGCPWQDVRWLGPEDTKKDAEELRRSAIRAQKFSEERKGWKW